MKRTPQLRPNVSAALRVSVSSLHIFLQNVSLLPTLSLHAQEIEANPLLLGSNLCGICSSVTLWDSSVLANIHPQCKLLYRT